MTLRLLFFAALFAALLFVLPAFAADTTRYPATLVEQTCTDSFNVPAAATVYNMEPAIQTSGTGDDKCDHDSRILTDAAIVADTAFGPFPGGKGLCFLVFADGNTVTGGDTKWGIAVQVTQPHDGVKQTIDSSAVLTGVTDGEFLIGLPTGYTYDSLDESLNLRIPQDDWYLILDLNTATSWLGEISMVGC
jgi:hypothetical protein